MSNGALKMGTWGTNLYSNDSASDVRADYLDKLKQGKSNEQATNELIEEYRDILTDCEESSLFWFALADTQWEYGRLLPFVKDKAMGYLSQQVTFGSWRDSENASHQWKVTLDNLATKLCSPMPDKKRVYRYRLYHCQWKLGDIFAYRLNGSYSKEKGLYGKYVVFQKNAEESIWPGHTVPIVHVFKWIGDNKPTLRTIINADLLVLNMTPKTLIYYKPDYERKYGITLMTTSQRDIPKDNLIYIGNSCNYTADTQQVDFPTGCAYVGWEGSKYNRQFERFIIDQYIAWKDIKGDKGTVLLSPKAPQD